MYVFSFVLRSRVEEFKRREKEKERKEVQDSTMFEENYAYTSEVFCSKNFQIKKLEFA